MLRIMGPSRREMQADIEKKLKEELLSNYDDHIYFKQYNEDHKVSILGYDKENQDEYDRIESTQRFWSICNVKNSKPYWAAHSESNKESQIVGMMQTLPYSLKNMIVNRPSLPYVGENLSGEFLPFNDSLPSFKSRDAKTGEVTEKCYRVPANLYVSQILDFIFNKLEVKDTILVAETDN